MERAKKFVDPDSDTRRGCDPPRPPAPAEYPSVYGAFEELALGTSREMSAWDVYNESRKVDYELVKDWTAGLNFLLVFAAIFSAILAAFIIESKKLLEEDPSEVMMDVMVFYTNNRANGTYTPYNRTKFQPTNSAISINCLLFGSLSTSLVAALASVIALQWVADFDAAITRGGSSPRDRAKRRQFRFSSVQTWKMGGIIASLPLLLYFSVVLFFVGVIQWMMVLNSTVGYVVIAGAVIAGLYYISSTVLAVLFVSAPFKTPLSRWIYSTYHLAFVGIHRITLAIRSNDVPSWIERRRHGYHAAHKREDRAVDMQIDLSYQAMNWLVRQVSISEDSRPRLVLLVAQLLEWSSGQLESADFVDGPWIFILNFLAKRHLDAVDISHQTSEEEEELAVLVNCAELPAVKAIIGVSKSRFFASPSSKHTLISLSHNLPVPSLFSKDEMHSTLRLAKWQISENKPLEVWKYIFENPNNYSDAFFTSAARLLCDYAKLAPVFTPKENSTVVAILMTISQKAVKSSTTSAVVTALIRAFEGLVSLYSPVYDSDACVGRPILYGQSLRRGTAHEQNTHRTLAYLLARDRQVCSESDKQRRLHDVLGMLWLNPFERDLLEWGRLRHDYGMHCNLGDLKQEILEDWILHVDDSLEIRETMCCLIQAAATDAQIGFAWMSPCCRKSSLHLFSLLRLFDALLSHDQTFVSPDKIFKVLCKALKLDESTAGKWHFTTDAWSHWISGFKNPYLRTVAYRALSISDIDEALPTYPFDWKMDYFSDQFGFMSETVGYMFWEMSIADPPSVWRLRATLIFDSPSPWQFDSAAKVFTNAFMVTEQLAALQLIFAHSTSCNHNPGPGHLLCHLQKETHKTVIYHGEITLLHDIRFSDLELLPVYALLAISGIEEMPLLELPEQYNSACMIQLWDYLASFKTKQSPMLSFLLELPLWHRKYPGRVEPGTAGIILQAIEHCLELDDDEESIPLFLPLSKHIDDLPISASDSFLLWAPQDMERKEVLTQWLVVHSRRVRDRVLTKLSTMTIYSQVNLRLVSCALSTRGVSPASAWRAMYVE